MEDTVNINCSKREKVFKYQKRATLVTPHFPAEWIGSLLAYNNANFVDDTAKFNDSAATLRKRFKEKFDSKTQENRLEPLYKAPEQ